MLLHWRVLVSSRDEATPTPLPKWGVGGRALPFFGKRRASAIGRLWLWCLLRNGAAVHLRCCGVAATRCEAAEGGLGAPLLVESSHASALGGILALKNEYIVAWALSGSQPKRCVVSPSEF